MRSLKILIRPSCRVIAMQYRTFDNKVRDATPLTKVIADPRCVSDTEVPDEISDGRQLRSMSS